MVYGGITGGEVPGSTVFVSEHVPASRVGFACACLFGALNIGLFLGALVGALTSAWMTAEALNSYGWRLAFVLGGIMGLVSVYLRRYLEETPLFEQLKVTKKLAKATPIKEVLGKHMTSVLLVLALALLLSEVNTVLFQFMPTFLQTQFKIPKATVFEANTAAIFVLALACPGWGWLGDRIGLGKALALGAGCTAIAAWCFFLQLPSIAANPTSLMVYWILIALPAAFIGLIPSIAAVAFPTAIRFTGIALPYNIGTALFAGFTPLVLSTIVHTFGSSGPAYLVTGVCAFAC